MKKKEAIPTSYVLGLIIETPEMKTLCQNPAVVKIVTNQTLLQIPALRSISNEHSLLSHTGNKFKCPQGTGRNPIIFFFTDSQTIPSLIPSLQHLCWHLSHQLMTATSRLGLQAYLLAIHYMHRSFISSAEKPSEAS